MCYSVCRGVGGGGIQQQAPYGHERRCRQGYFNPCVPLVRCSLIPPLHTSTNPGRETSGLFAAIPSLLRSIGSGGGGGGGGGSPRVAGLLGTSDPYRQQDGYLPQVSLGFLRGGFGV